MTCNDSTKQFAVNWNNHMNHVKKAFDDLLISNELTDVTLYAEGKKIKAHKMLLSACSFYFKSIFKDIPQDHPIIILKGVKFTVLSDILKFIYNGEVSIDSEMFETFLQTAEFLKISGLTESDKYLSNEQNDNITLNEAEENSVDANNSQVTERLRCNEGVNTAKRGCFKADLDKVKIKKLAEDFPVVKIEPSDNDLTEIFEESLLDPLHLKRESQYNQATGSQVIFNDEAIKNGLADRKSASGLFECELCGKSYRIRDSLYKHLSVHAGNTTCIICSKVLSRKTHLERHMIMTHGVYLHDLKKNSKLKTFN